jgi:hypothetical protein
LARGSLRCIGVGRGAVSITESKGRRMGRLGIAALDGGTSNVPTGYVRPGQRVVNPKAVYGSQRGHAAALYRRINGWPALPTRPETVHADIYDHGEKT